MEEEGKEFDVFLSFRGEDTRRNFTKFLYEALVRNGIETFLDDDELERGKDIAGGLDKAIEKSKVAVVVFSETYAFSRWCLNELVKIDKRRAEEGLTVLPVFYEVDPSHIRHQKEGVGVAFEQHKKNPKNDMATVKQWEKTLTRIANLSGWHLADRDTYPDVIRHIISDIRAKLQPYDIVGMDSRFREFEAYLNCKSEAVHMVGIWGTGGIGKTTLAKEVKKRIEGDFEDSCFVERVRERCKKEDCLTWLEKHLDENLKHKKASMKVLIILDDVDEETLVEGLDEKVGPGSKILITTRDRETLKRCGVEDTCIYEVKILTKDDSLELFSRKAFRKNRPRRYFEELSWEFVNYADGLPLALEILGNFLNFYKSEDQWKGELDRLRNTPHEGITKVLRFSYDTLSYEAKQTFLDIACFFEGEDESRLIKIFESCKYFPDISLSVLVTRSLISILGGKVWMHGMLQQMGWEMIVEEAARELGKYSRLWRHEDALRVLQENMGKEAVKGIFFTSPRDEEIHSDPFVNMKMLRLLKISNVKIFPESHEFYVSKELRLLEWHGYPLERITSSTFQCESLVELSMPNSRLEHLWKQTRHLEKLVLIDLSNCENLTETPEFSFVPNLERLILEGCKSLSQVHPSIGELQHLVSLNLRGCENLEELPRRISLRSLTTFILSGCSNLKEFPEINEGDMEKLTELHLDGTDIRELPSSVKLLTGLTLLRLQNCNNLLNVRSGIFCHMKSLKALNLSGCLSMDQLPEDLGSLENLENFFADGTAIRTLPSSIGLLRRLKTLSLQGCGLVQLPDEIGFLSSLQHLNLRENNFVSIPESISQLCELTSLYLRKCSKLQSLPKKFPLNLRTMEARDCPMLTEYSKTELTIWTSNKGFHFIDCRDSSNVDEDSTIGVPLPMPKEHSDLLLPKYVKGLINDGKQYETRFPFTTIPLWCSNWRTSNPVKIELSTEDHEDPGRRTKGFALIVVFVIKNHDNSDGTISCHFDINKRRLKNSLDFANFKHFRVGTFAACNYRPLEWFREELTTSSRIIEASFSKTRSDIELLKFGMHQVLEKDVETFSEDFAQSANDHLDPELGFSRHCKRLLDGANEVERLGGITKIGIRKKQETSGLGESHSSRTAWDNIPSIEHKCFINETYKLLLELFQGPIAYHNPFQFVLPFSILSPWFFHHSVGNMAVCFLPPNIHNDETWLGLELYVHCRRPHRFYSVVLEVDLYAHGKRRLHVYPRQHKTCNSDFVALHVPRKYFPKELNDCEGISAFFKPATPDVKVKMCGTRLLYKQDSELLSKGLIEAVLWRPDLLLYLNNFVKELLQNDESDNDEWEMPQSSRMTTLEPREKDVLKSSQMLLTNTEQEVKEVSTSLDKHRKEYAKKRANSDGFGSVLLHSKKSFLAKWDHIQENASENSSVLFNHLHITAETLLHTSDSQNQIEYLKYLLSTIFFEHRFLVTLSLKGHIAFVLRHFRPSLPYNLCFPQKKIPEWFKHQYTSSTVQIALPPNLNNDKRWRGLVICAAFSVTEHPDTFSKASFRLLCHLACEEYGCLNPVAYCSVTKDKIKWVHLRGFIWLTYIPHVMLTELGGKQMVEARLYNYCPGLIVDKCGVRLLYEKDVKKLKEIIIQFCTSFVEDLDPVYQFLESQDDEDLTHALSTETGGTNDDQTLSINSHG